MKLKNNKKGVAQFVIFGIFVAGILIIALIGGTLTGYQVSNTFKTIPIWFWIIIGVLILLFAGGKKR